MRPVALESQQCGVCAHGCCGVVTLAVGVVKVTPAHDPKDFECGLRHNLPEKVVIDKSCRLCGDVDEGFVGLDRYDARAKVVETLKQMGLYVDKVRACRELPLEPTSPTVTFTSLVCTLCSWTIRRRSRSARGLGT